MEIIYTVSELRRYLKTQKCQGKRIGLVPTMGAIHQGHRKLISESLLKCDLTVCSIFVNPAQFNNPSDLDKYPRRIDSDIKTLDITGCDVLFLPEASEMYPDKESISMRFGKLENVMEGQFRPGHFSGVGLILSKLFNIINPDSAFFGQKDIQQVAIVRKLVRDLNFDVLIEVVDTIREPSGLAMSSRNMLLNDDDKKLASILYRELIKLKAAMDQGTIIPEALATMKSAMIDQENIELEYLNVVDSETMEEVVDLTKDNISVCVAATVSGVRIIDNIYLKRKN